MSKLLITICAFGLLLASAFAQDKSPEQLREERARIFGVEGQESQTFTRVIDSGAKQRIGFYASLNPDCTATGDVTVRVTKQPEHGTVETLARTEYAHYPKENIRSKRHCPVDGHHQTNRAMPEPITIVRPETVVRWHR
jgi:hypothetical protein